MPIPKKIFSIWLSNDNKIPPLIEKCINSQKDYCEKNNYEYELITLDNCFKDSEYIQQCLNSPHRDGIRYCKASDYLRLYYLKNFGGIYLDSDVEVVGSFDTIIHHKMFVGEEGCQTISNSIVIGSAVIGAEANHPFICELLEVMETQYRGDDNDNYECSMHQINMRGVKWQHLFKIYKPEYFYPYNHHTGVIRVSDKTIAIHHFNKSWVDFSDTDKLPDFPVLSIIIPHLDREDGLQKCIASIKESSYPQDRIQIIVIDGEGTVPQKVNKGLELSNGEYIIYLANDTVIDKHCLLNAVLKSISDNKALVSFNEGYVLEDEGNICAHFLLRKDFIRNLEDMEIFHTSMNHVGVDNYLWAQVKKLNNAVWCEECIIKHNHFSNNAGQFDNVYQKGWEKAEADRETLKLKLELLK